MAYGPNLFTGQLTTENSPELISPPQLDEGALGLEGSDSLSSEIASLAGNREPVKGIQLNDSMISTQATFVARSGEQVMPNNNPESFLREGGLIVDGPHIYIDSIEQSQCPSTNLRGALIRMVQSGATSIAVRTFTKDKVINSGELIRRRFRLL